ncbi:MAG: hypothetical protein A2Y33_14765 [Spirochaetes bacterium GWF1_51_8]|nr:MAG: hypothetical protein A2Y33_14765 [Spirochaetes bacterium GWF1_51_8]
MSPADFDFGVNSNDTLHMFLNTSGSLYFYAYDMSADRWNTNYFAGIGLNPKMDYDGGSGLSGMYIVTPNVFQITYENQGGWQYFQETAGNSNSTQIYDYCAGPGTACALVYQNSIATSEFFVFTLGSTNNYQFDFFSQMNSPGTIFDLSIDHNSYGTLFIGIAQPDSVAIFSFAGPSTVKQYTIPYGKGIAKVVVTKDERIYLFFQNDENELIAKVFEYRDNDLKDYAEFTVYTGGIKIEPSFLPNALDIEYDAVNGNIYAAFIDPGNNYPIIMKIRNTQVSPVFMIPSHETNSRCIKITVDQDGDPVAGVLNYSNTLNFYSR